MTAKSAVCVKYLSSYYIIRNAGAVDRAGVEFKPKKKFSLANRHYKKYINVNDKRTSL